MSGGRIEKSDFITTYGGALAGPMMGYEYEISHDGFDSWEHGDEDEYAKETFGILPDRFEVQAESLGWESGFEIKSPVANLQTHKRTWNRLVKKFDVTQPTESHEGGIHINVDSTANAYPAAFVRLMFNHKRTFKLASGRTWDFWNEYCCFDIESDGVVDEYENYASRSQHYHIFNMDKHYAYEFRMFKAEPKLLVPALELADAAIAFCNPLNEKDVNRHGDPLMSMTSLMNVLGSSSKYSHARKVMVEAIHATNP